MVKKLRYQECRRSGRRQHRQPRLQWVLEPLDAAVVAAAIAALCWLQWLAPGLTH